MNTDCHTVVIGITNGGHVVTLTIVDETTVHTPCPHIQRLLDMSHSICVRKVKAKTPQMKPMGILTQPFRRVSLSSRLLKLSRIQLFMSLTMHIAIFDICECFFNDILFHICGISLFTLIY